MTIELSPTEWRKELISFSKNGFTSSDIICYKNKAPEQLVNPNDIKRIKDAFMKDCNENRIKRRAQYDMRMIQMRPLFAGLPQFEKICKNRDNFFVDSCCKTYLLRDDEDEDKDKDIYEDSDMDKLHEKVIDLKYIINLCGYNLTKLDVQAYPFSEIMPLINNNCPNLEILLLAFKEIESQDFENVFSNISHLMSLTIQWRCEYSTLPDTLAKSLEQVGGTLDYFYLQCISKNNVLCLPNSLALAFLRFVVLKRLRIHGFEPSQLLIGAIGLMENLVNLSFFFSWKKHQMIPKKIDMHPIGYLKNLEMLNIDIDSGVTDEFLINLSNNARKLKRLLIIDTYITDKGIDALKNLKGLKTYPGKVIMKKYKYNIKLD
ncbi:hypothetical protein HCN44_003572 [Aphidius gifuensis]|uniref:Uncharacterized protein n=1 Tax=Aphidius gifuensis TaxID=684658 RepID=A0A835CLU7_APHGI|nr:uncharacterized protein LOC122858908 [Aphidius gifuensis]KAF7987709.1 hypothetical protein HCN44_003572 [Aphidius gifuensis]